MALPDSAMEKDPATGRLRAFDMPANPRAAAPAVPDYSALSPEQAKAELKRLGADPEFRAKSIRNDPGALAMRRALDARVVNMDPAQATKLLAGDADAVGAANAVEQAAADAMRAEMEAPPATPESYEIPADVSVDATPEQLENIRAAAFSVGVSPGEFKNFARVFNTDKYDEPPTGQVLESLADAVGRDLDERHGPEEAAARARRVVAVITKISEGRPAAFAYLHYAILANRPLFNCLARVGERMEKR